MPADLNMRIARGPQSGFSIIELMIGIALGLVILAALTGFFVSTSANRNELERTTRQIENGRFAIDSLRNEVKLAGFYAELSQSGATLTTPDPCQTAIANLGLVLSPLQVPLAVYGYPADSAMFPACVTDRVPNTDVLVLRRFNTETVAVGSATPAQAYVQMSRCATDSTTVPWIFALGSSAGSFTLRKIDCATRSDLYQFRVETFYVRTYSNTPGDGIPTLVKVDLDSGAMRISPLVEGIQSMRISYGIDDNGDGAPDEFLRCDTATPCTPTQWSNIVTVRASVLAENLEDTLGYSDAKTYDMGNGYTIGPLNDRRKRHVYSATLGLPNRSGPRE